MSELQLDPRQRYVIIHPTRGIHLGGGVWSKDKGPKPTFAPTYHPSLDLSDFKECSFSLVFPSLPGYHASVKDCEDAMLSGWTDN